ncbi:MAG: ACP S-malonyltransferase [Nitrospinota bacterium]|nr:ACP S-malonyltransferase [Nitrospinota bacterium]
MSNGKIAFVFPGQGAQKIGMGKNLAETSAGAANLMKRADNALGFSLSSLCYNGPEEELSKTEITQPALFTAGAMALEAFREKCGIKPDFVAGHSLGEFSAIYAAGGYSFEDGLRIVRNRGLYMSDASGGVMAAVLGLDVDSIKTACASVASGDEFIQPANYNGEGQTVIAGTPSALEAVTPLLKEKGAKRIIPLKVSAAFHTPFMADAEKRLTSDLAGITFHDLNSSLVNNVDAKIVSTAREARDGSGRQVTGAVRWTEIMQVLINEGVKTVVEFGIGKTLVGMLKREDKSLVLCSVEDAESLKETLEILGR